MLVVGQRLTQNHRVQHWLTSGLVAWRAIFRSENKPGAPSLGVTYVWNWWGHLHQHRGEHELAFGGMNVHRVFQPLAAAFVRQCTRIPRGSDMEPCG